MNFEVQRKKRESELERAAMQFAEAHGWWQIKIERASKNGYPDRELIRNGRTIRIEFKRPGEKPSPQQRRRHDEIRAHGGEVYVIDNIEVAKELLR